MDILLLALAAFLAIFIIVYLILFHAVIRRWKKVPSADDAYLRLSWRDYFEAAVEGRQWFRDQGTERVEITSHDGLKLAGFYLPAENPIGTILLMHGYRSDGFIDHSTTYRFYHELGLNILSANQRAHGESEGKYITYGVLERFDCQGWVKYLSRRQGSDAPLLLGGASMGCTTVLLASGLELEGNVRGIIADCGFTSAWEIYRFTLRKRLPLPTWPLINIFDFISKRIAGFSAAEVRTTQALESCKVPVLFLHGRDDEVVPYWMSVDNYEACPTEKKLILVPGARHEMSFVVDNPQCSREIRDFVYRTVGGLKDA